MPGQRPYSLAVQCVAVTGATGLIGRALIEALVGKHYRVIALTRDPQAEFPAGVEVRRFDPMGAPSPLPFEGADAIVHLAGETVAGRWSAAKKKLIYNSRVVGTRTVVDSLAQMSMRPRAFICASAVGYYGARGDEPLVESSAAGNDFLANVCEDWEREAAGAAVHGMRVARLRTGIVLSAHGGALAQMLRPFQLGAGGPFGSGRQFVPWIHIEDLVRMYLFALENDAVTGAVNAVSPDYATSARFAQAFGCALRRPAIIPAPGFALRMLLGEFAETILASQLVIPEKPTDWGFTWKHTRLESALRSLFHGGHQWDPLRRYACGSFVPKPIDEVFAFFSNPRNLDAITPPALGFRILSTPPQMERGAQITYRLRLHGLPIAWRTLITAWEPPHRFADVQLHGPYSLWEHEHEFESVEGGTIVRDRVTYSLPQYPFSNLAAGAVESDIDRIFAFRQESLQRMLA